MYVYTVNNDLRSANIFFPYRINITEYSFCSLYVKLKYYDILYHLQYILCNLTRIMIV